jgi:hypothetical protein
VLKGTSSHLSQSLGILKKEERNDPMANDNHVALVMTAEGIVDIPI